MSYLDNAGVAKLWEKIKAYVNQHSSGGVALDDIYPVGSIYMSVSEDDPEMLFGGEWEQILDSFLLAAGSSYEVGETGGEATHTLSTNEMPTHSHTGGSHTHSTPNHTHTLSTASGGGTGNFWATMWGNDVASGIVSAAKQYRNKTASSGSNLGTTSYTINTAHTHTINQTASGGGTSGSGGAVATATTGGGAAHNNMPPYLAVYMWIRTA